MTPGHQMDALFQVAVELLGAEGDKTEGLNMVKLYFVHFFF